MDQFIMRVLDLFARHDMHSELFWRTDAKYAPISFFANCSDIFFWGSADAQPLTLTNIGELEKAIQDVIEITGESSLGFLGVDLFCARQRKERPQGACYPRHKEVWPLLDACGPEREIGLGNPCRPGERFPN